MAVKVGINGFGRIGRNVFRAALGNPDIDFVAVNDLTSPAILAHLLKHDSILGNITNDVVAGEDFISVDGKKIKVFAERDPAKLDWASTGAEIVVESTGHFTDATKAKAHLGETVKKVIISAPATNEDVSTRPRRQPAQVRSGQAQRHLQCQLHHQLPGPGRQGAHRGVWHRQRHHDHDPQLHQRPSHSRLPTQGSAPRPRRRHQHDPQFHRRSQGPLACLSRDRRHAGRLLHARSNPQRLHRRPDLHQREAPPASRKSTPLSRPPRKANSRASSALRPTSSSAPTSRATSSRRSSMHR